MYSSLLQQLTVADLQKWGYIPELLGRIGTFLTMNPMSEELIYEIITTASENILNAHKAQCQMHGFELEFTEDALRKIAKMATESGLGFRSVKTILANLMEDVYFDCDRYKDSTLTVNEEFISLGYFRNKYRPLIKDYKKMSQGKIKVEHLLEKYNYTPEEYAKKLRYLKQL
jgi:ATP-dependent protease Clp ATPase subunit